MTDKCNPEYIRMIEAVLFAAAEPLDKDSLAERLPAQDVDMIDDIVQALEEKYKKAGFHLVKVADKFAFRTAPDLAHMLQKDIVQQRRLSKAALETLAIIAYHQPVTRAEIEAIRGVSISKGTLDVLLESTWVKLRGRRRVPGRPVTYGTTDAFLIHFGLENLRDLPGLNELRAAGLLDGQLPPDFSIPAPDPDNDPTEDPLEDEPPLEMDIPE